MLLKLARIQEQTLYSILEDDINEQTISNYPFVHVVFHLKNQSFLIERKSAVFSDVNSAKNVLEQLLNEKMREYYSELSIMPISNEMGFWDGIKVLEKLDEVTLFMKSPNLWLGESSTEEALKDLENEYANDELEISLRSSAGVIKPDNARMRRVIDYITKGGGWWRIKGKKSGERKIISSRDNVESLSLPKNSLEDMSETVISDINKAVEIKERDSNA